MAAQHPYSSLLVGGGSYRNPLVALVRSATGSDRVVQYRGATVGFRSFLYPRKGRPTLRGAT